MNQICILQMVELTVLLLCINYHKKLKYYIIIYYFGLDVLFKNMLFPDVERDVEEWLNMNEGNYVVLADSHREYGAYENIHKFREMFNNNIHDRILFYRLGISYSMFEIMLDNSIPWIHFRPKKEWRGNLQVKIHDNIVSIHFEGDKFYKNSDIKLEDVWDVREIYTHLKDLYNVRYKYSSWTCDNYFDVIPKLETIQNLLDKNIHEQDFTNITIEI